jgi:hypothetical protein
MKMKPMRTKLTRSKLTTRKTTRRKVTMATMRKTRNLMKLMMRLMRKEGSTRRMIRTRKLRKRTQKWTTQED